MTIFSWNMLYRNKRLTEALRFITETDFDIFCLQEVPEPFLNTLRALPYHMISRQDAQKEDTQGAVRMYHVVLSRFPIRGQGAIPFPDYWQTLPWRSRLFIALMPDPLFAKVGARSGIWADIERAGGLVRVFSLHLVLAQPSWRLEEFERAMAERIPNRPTIVCGDFNILEKPHITPLNWILGASLSDALFFTRERATIEQRFTEHALANPLRGENTHPLSRSQLDHILVSRHFRVEHASVIAERYGSDHHPISAEISTNSDTSRGGPSRE